jgi:hypothetical protein
MLEILQFIFSSFWIWLGTLVLIIAIGEAISTSIIAIFGGYTRMRERQ